MNDEKSTEDRDLAAGDFSSWLGEVRSAIRGERASDVPCDGCTACCTSSQFVHVGPDETDTLSHIPPQLLFPAPGRPHGHVVLGYDEHGHCPMLVNGACSIYEHRPETCRTYDCRIFPAAGIDADADDESKASIGRRARRWQFSYPTAADRAERDAVRAAARFIEEHSDLLPPDVAPANATQRAVRAIEMHGDFLPREGK